MIQINTRWLTVASIIALTCIIFLFSSCYTDKKAAEQVNKAIDKKPLIALPIFRGKFPCTTTKSDTTISVKDTVIMVDCPDTAAPDNGNQYFTVYDTLLVYKDRIKKIQVPVKVPSITKYITNTIEDSAKIKEKDIQIADLKNKLLVSETKLKGKSTQNLWLWIAVIILSCGHIINLYIKFKNKLPL